VTFQYPRKTGIPAAGLQPVSPAQYGMRRPRWKSLRRKDASRERDKGVAVILACTPYAPQARGEIRHGKIRKFPYNTDGISFRTVFCYSFMENMISTVGISRPLMIPGEYCPDMAPPFRHRHRDDCKAGRIISAGCISTIIVCVF